MGIVRMRSKNEEDLDIEGKHVMSETECGGGEGSRELKQRKIETRR